MALHISKTGLLANQQRLRVSAHNTANLNTDGFGKQRIIQSGAKNGGVQTHLDRLTLSPEAREASERLNGAQNNVSAAEETVARISTQAGFAQNARAVKVSDELLKSLLDVMG